MAELKMTGNSLKSSRPILSFSKVGTNHLISISCLHTMLSISYILYKKYIFYKELNIFSEVVFIISCRIVKVRVS